MNRSLALRSLVLGSSLLAAASCGGGGGGSSSGRMTIQLVSNGFGQMLPHQVRALDGNGIPTNELINITGIQQIVDNVTLSNSVLPPTEWSETATLPNFAAGNHFIYVRFSQPIDIDSVLNGTSAASVENNLRGTIDVLGVDPVLGTTTRVSGRAFIGGQTYGAVDPLNPGRLLLEDWVALDGDGKPEALDVNGSMPGLGFPGTQDDFSGSTELVDPRTFVFVADSDSDLSTHETFPAGLQIRMVMTREVLGVTGESLREEGLASATVGEDDIAPEVAVSGQSQNPLIIPGNGDLDVDPSTPVLVSFSEPIQIPMIGDFDDGSPATPGSAIQLTFGPSSQLTNVPFTVRPLSPYDLSRVELVPAFAFPGSGPVSGGASCGVFSQIRVVVNAPQFADLNGIPNTQTPSTQFFTGEGPGLVNVPVAPDAIYVGRSGSQPGLSVVDLNGFGAGTGNPTFDPQNPAIEGNSNFPNDPNVSSQGTALIPPLIQGTCTFNGGSSGTFSLAKDSALSDLVLTSPLIESVGDMAIGHPLDNTFNNGSPNGCQAGGGNACASTGLKQLRPGTQSPRSFGPAEQNFLPIKIIPAGENLICWAPHPNPPPLVFPPLCLSPFIGAQEPTSVIVVLQPPPINVGLGRNNLLTPGPNIFGDPDTQQPASSLLAQEQNQFMIGPPPPATDVNNCLATFQIRQQIGHFLYLVDRVAAELVVLNSNRMSVIDRIALPDPTELAMSPNVDLLAVTNERAATVTLIDINPDSSTFHQIVRNVRVGRGPTGIAWDPGNEDILVCNTADSSVSIISAFSFEVRKTVRNQIFSPIDVAITPRQRAHGFFRDVFFAYILNSDGRLAFFESGPSGVNGWGFDDVVGTPPFTFVNPKAIRADTQNLNSAVWIVHENRLNPDGTASGEVGGAVSQLAIVSGAQGRILLTPLSSGIPEFRQLQFELQASIGNSELTGVPVDIAFDNQLNVAAFTNQNVPGYSAGIPRQINGKNIVVVNQFNVPAAASSPRFMFLAVPNSIEGPGVIDVIEVTGGVRRFDTNPYLDGIQSIQAPGVNVLMDYYRQ